MIKKISFMLVLLLMIGGVFAGSLEVGTEKVGREMQDEELPGPLKKLFGDVKINIHLTSEEGDKVLNLVTEEGKLKGLMMGEVEDPDMKFYSDEATFEEILKSEDPLLALKEAIDAGTVEYKAVGFWNKIKFAFVKVFAKLAMAFGGEEEEEEFVEAVKENELTGEVVSDEVEEEVVIEKLEDIGEQVPQGSSETGTIEEEMVEEEVGPKTHNVDLITGGFSVNELNIKVGDTVNWENTRTEGFTKALIVGAQRCGKVKSKIFLPGESFSYTFEEAQTCLIVDGIYTTELMNIFVNE